MTVASPMPSPFSPLRLYSVSLFERLAPLPTSPSPVPDTDKTHEPEGKLVIFSLLQHSQKRTQRNKRKRMGYRPYRSSPKDALLW